MLHKIINKCLKISNKWS